MPEPLTDIADPQGALIALVLALVLIAAAGAWAFAGWRRLRRSMDAAQALIDIHMESLNARIAAVEAAAQLPVAGSQKLQARIESLRVSIRELRYLLALVPRERLRLKRRLADIALPTGPTQ